jgi:hypothetical protein
MGAGVLRAGLLLAVALVVAAGLGLLGGWVARPSRRPARDYGLLVAVATGTDAASAAGLAERLEAAGIRSTVVPADGPVLVSHDGRLAPRGTDVLVFPDDLCRAREAIGAQPG